MFIIMLLCSFFITLNASEDEVTSVDGFLQTICEHLKGNYSHRATTSPLELYERDIVVTYLNDGNGGCRFQLVHDPEHILMKSYDEFYPPQETDVRGNARNIAMYRLAGGTREVAACSINGKKRFCFKQWPEAPGIEIAARQFFEMFMPDGENVPIPRSVTIAINGQVFSVSEFIEGVPLRGFLEIIKDDDPCRFFDTLSFQRLVLFCMITNPEDCRLENCLVRQKSNGDYEIILIDNERSFGKEVVEGTVPTRVHCVPFCFHDMMKQQIALKDTLCSTMVNGAKLAERLSKLLNEHKYQRALFDMHKDQLTLRARQKKVSILGLPLGEEFIRNLMGKWSAITYKIIFENKNLADIFSDVMPKQLVDSYLTDAEPGESVLDRIMKVDPGRNGTSGTPPSSWVSLPDYFFSKEPPTTDSLLAIFNEILQKYGWQFTPKTIKEIISLMVSLERQRQSHV